MNKCPTCGHDSDDDKRQDEGDPRVREDSHGSWLNDRRGDES